jgi:hypothetical protein
VVTGPPAAVRGKTVIASVRSPEAGRVGAGAEVRRHFGQPAWRAKSMDAVTRALVEDGAELAVGQLAIFTMNNAHWDIEPERPTIRLAGDAPVRVITLDSAGDVTLDVSAAREIELPAHTDRVVLLAGASRNGAGAPGWHSGTRLVQLGRRALVGPSCAIVTAGLVTRRGGVRVASGYVNASDAVDGYTIVSTRLPRDVVSVAIVLEPLDRVDDDRADLLELGLEGAERALAADGDPIPPIVIDAGARRMYVYALATEKRKADTVEITVATGEHVHLGGVIGARTSAPLFAETLARRDLASIVGPIVDVVQGTARIRFEPQPSVTR